MTWGPLEIAGAVVVIGGALTLIISGMRWAARAGKNLADIKDDLLGEPARDGVPERPSVMKRLATAEQGQAEIKRDIGAIKRELTFNGGESLKDTVVKMAKQLDTLMKERNQAPVTVNVGTNPPQQP